MERRLVEETDGASFGMVVTECVGGLTLGFEGA